MTGEGQKGDRTVISLLWDNRTRKEERWLFIYSGQELVDVDDALPDPTSRDDAYAAY